MARTPKRILTQEEDQFIHELTSIRRLGRSSTKPKASDLVTRKGNPFRPGTLEYMTSQLIIGQDHAIEKICPYIYTYLSGTNAPNRTVGNILEIGPTGVGKTETAEALAKILHGDRTKYMRLDCGEYKHGHTTARLTQAPPGYVGHEVESVLSDRRLASVRSDVCNLAIVLLDEIEKASPDLWELLLGILDKASLTTIANKEFKVISFEDVLILMTSNVGVKQLQEKAKESFGLTRTKRKMTQSQIDSALLKSVDKTFSPEFINRLNEIIVYRSLTSDHVSQIFDIQIAAYNELLYTRQIEEPNVVTFTDEAKEFLIKKGVSAEYGARELRRTLQRYIFNRIGRALHMGMIKPGYEIKIVLTDDKKDVYVKGGVAEYISAA